jgi:hypothetical protein
MGGNGLSGGQSGIGRGRGRGGIGRGPGDAVLALTEDAQGGAEGALALPKGAAVPSEWVRVGSTRIEPEVRPEANTAAGGAGAAGAGGPAWRLDLAPRHRTVLQRFFGDGADQPRDKR